MPNTFSLRPPHGVSPRDRWLCVLPRWRLNVNVNVPKHTTHANCHVSAPPRGRARMSAAVLCGPVLKFTNTQTVRFSLRGVWKNCAKTMLNSALGLENFASLRV